MAGADSTQPRRGLIGVDLPIGRIETLIWPILPRPGRPINSKQKNRGFSWFSLFFTKPGFRPLKCLTGLGEGGPAVGRGEVTPLWSIYKKKYPCGALIGLERFKKKKTEDKK